MLGTRLVLLVVDVQQGFNEPSWGHRNNPEMEARIEELLAVWRTTGRLTIHVKHCSTEPSSTLRPGQSGNGHKACVAPIAGELVIEKRVHCCFIGTPLEADLRGHGCDTLVIVGLTTNYC